MFITTVIKGDDTTYRLHRDNCDRKNGTERSLEEQNANDPQITLDAQPCSKCKPNKAVQVQVRFEAQKALDARSKGKGKVAAAIASGEDDLVTSEGLALVPDRPQVQDATVAEVQGAQAEAPAEATIGRGHTLAAKDGEQVCDTCGRTLPLTKFPTLPAKAGEVPQRGTTCREDVKKAREAKKAAK